MIMKFLKKIPAGMMVVPMLLGAFINTFFPQITGIGSFTTAIFTSAGANTAIGIQLFCLGTTLRFREIAGPERAGHHLRCHQLQWFCVPGPDEQLRRYG